MHLFPGIPYLLEKKRRGILKKLSSLKHPDLRKKLFTWHILKYNFYFHSATALQWARAFSLSRLRKRTQTHYKRYDSSGRVISPMKRPLPHNTQHSQETDIHAPGGNRTRNTSKRAAADKVNLCASIFISWTDFLQDWKGRPISGIHWPTTWVRRPRVTDEASYQCKITRRKINSEIQ